RMGWVTELLDQLQVDAVARARIWGGTAAAWLGLDGDAPPQTRPRAAANDLDPTSPDGDPDHAVIDADDGGTPMRLRRICC
ncbi:MAG: hypothetical protein ABIV63_20730, partial [Caldimonas sp.]